MSRKESGMRLGIGLCGVCLGSIGLHLVLFFCRYWYASADFVEFTPTPEWKHQRFVALESGNDFDFVPTRFPSPVQLADGEREARHAQPKPAAQSPAPPAALAPVDAKAAPAPIQDLVREIIENELADTSAEEREIWYEQFRNLAPAAIRDMLRVRKEFGSLSPRPEAPIVAKPVISQPLAMPIPATMVPESMPGTMRWSEIHPDLLSIRKASQLHWENLVHAETPGFLARTVELQAVTQPSGITGTELGQTRLQLVVAVSPEPGNPLETESPHDVRLLGLNWMRVRNGALFGFTRYGRLERFADGRVGIQSGSTRWDLEPAICIPETAEKTWSILPDGSIQWPVAGESTPASAPIPIVQHQKQEAFMPLDLVVVGHAAAAEARLLPVNDSPRLVLGQLIGSNTNPDHELSAMKRLQDRRRQLELALDLLLR